MTDEEAYKIIGERAQQIAETLKSEFEKLYKEGTPIEDIEKYAYQLALGTLWGMHGKYE